MIPGRAARRLHSYEARPALKSQLGLYPFMRGSGRMGGISVRERESERVRIRPSYPVSCCAASHGRASSRLARPAEFVICNNWSLDLGP